MDKNKQKQLITEIMQEDQKDGLYNQTAVEWLFKKLWDEPKDKFTWYALLKESKQIEKNHILAAYLTGIIHPLEMDISKGAEKYYEQNYESRLD